MRAYLDNACDNLHVPGPIYRILVQRVPDGQTCYRHLVSVMPPSSSEALGRGGNRNAPSRPDSRMSQSPMMPCKRGSSPWTCFSMPDMGLQLQTAALEEQAPSRLRTLHGYYLVPRSAEKLLRTNHHDSTIYLLSFLLLMLRYHHLLM
ncbi:hypothetical protein AHAS_Ahas12G0141700 [Arachis hypogaea]